MKRIILILVLFSNTAFAGDYSKVMNLAHANGYHPSPDVIESIVYAAHRWHIRAVDLAAIGILETGLGKYNRPRHNSNGTVDIGLFQINTVNRVTCIEYNLRSNVGSALCAAKLLHLIKSRHADYIGRYHSNTLWRRLNYLHRVQRVLKRVAVND